MILRTATYRAMVRPSRVSNGAMRIRKRSRSEPGRGERSSAQAHAHAQGAVRPHGLRRGGCLGMGRESAAAGAWTGAEPPTAVAMRASAAGRVWYGSMAMQALARRRLGAASGALQWSGVSFFVLTWCVFSQIRRLGGAHAVFQPIDLPSIFASTRQTVPVVRNAG